MVCLQSDNDQRGLPGTSDVRQVIFIFTYLLPLKTDEVMFQVSILRTFFCGMSRATTGLSNCNFRLLRPTGWKNFGIYRSPYH